MFGHSELDLFQIERRIGRVKAEIVSNPVCICRAGDESLRIPLLVWRLGSQDRVA